MEKRRERGHPDESVHTVGYGGKEIEARRGERLLDAILRAGVDHRHLCGGRGFCTSCRVEVLSGQGLSPTTSLERERLGELAGRVRLACQCFVRGDVSVDAARAVSRRFSPDGE